MNTDTKNFEGHIPGIVECTASISKPSGLESLLFSSKPIVTAPEVGTDEWVKARTATAELLTYAPDLLRERNELRHHLERLMMALRIGGDDIVGESVTDATNCLARCGK